MAGHPLFEDQTDEDFFDKLVDDEFGIGEASSGAEAMRRGLSNLSLGDLGAHVEDMVSGEVEAREAVGGSTVDAVEADVMSSEDGSSSVVPADSQTFGEAATSAGNFPVAAEDAGSQHPEKHGRSKGTSVKVVQWSAFSTDGQQQSDLGGFGSFSDFFPEDLGMSSDNVFALPESTATGAETYVTDVGPSFESHRQQDEGQFFNDAGQQEAYTATAEMHDGQQYNPDVTDSLYWENMYPGWKYDHNTNEWYQVEGQEASSNALTDDGSLVTGEAGSQEASYANAYHTSNEIISEQGPEVSYLQKGSHNALEAVAESPVTGSVTNWNDFSQGSMQYPSNMVFDPQYPEYYYDTVTMQWYTLESYFQTVQTTTTKDQEQLGNAVSDGSASIQSSSFYNNATQYENYSFISQNSNEIGSAWTGQASSSYSTGAWQTVVEDKNASQNNFSKNQLTGSFHVPSNSLGNFLKSDMGGDFSRQSSWQPSSSGQTGSLHDSSNNHLTRSIHSTTGFMGSTSQSLMSGSSSTHSTWQPGTTDQSRMLGGFSESQMISSSSDVTGSMGQFSDKYMDSARNEAIPGQGFGLSSGSASFQGFTPTEKLPQFGQSIRQISQINETTLSNSYYSGLTSSSHLEQSYQVVNQPFHSGNLSYSQFTSSSEGRSSAGRPAHALITFGFGGKLIVMKQTGADLSYASRDVNGKTLSILNLADIVTSTSDTSSIGLCSHAYFDSLCKHSFPGPLVGGNAATKDLNKWIDEKISNCVPSSADYKKSKHLRLILSLLKISFQHYGKLRSPFGTDPSVMESDGPESAVTKLFASARENGGHPMDYGSIANCMHNMPTEGQIRTTAVEVQHLLVSGRRQEALQCAQKGLLWGPALVLAAQLGEKFYVDTVRRMAQDQFISGSPLRTLCLLIAGQPADVFSEDGFSNEFSGGAHAPKKAVANGMLDSWEENLAIITANRTKDDELVMVHLGDCLWKERDEIVAAHTCYLVAEANFESYSDSARLCLVGADHWKCPRTYASPDAIQRTELYEYSKVLGNSQFVLLPFQPYKLVYAYMLAEVGKISDSLRYCQAILKILKNSSRAPETETWKQLTLSLEERLKTHQQGGYGSNLAPAKLVGKLFTSIDKSISRMMGSPPSLPPMPHSAIPNNGNDNRHVAPKVSTSQSSMAISSLMPSLSGEKINELTGDSRRIMHNRSVSEPDFGRSPKQENTGDPSSTDSQSKASNASGPSRIGRLGSQLFQKTIGWVARSRTDRQAKLGDSNKFYYDEKLKRWVEEGVDPPPEEAALPPPPTTSAFQNVGSDYNINSALSQSLSSNERTEAKPTTSAEPSSAMPPIPPSTNQFAARGRLGVRSRYVDTFNKGGGVSAASFQAPSAPSIKSISSANFFVPSPIASSQSTGDVTDANAEASSNEDASSLVIKDSPHSSLSSSSSSHSISRFPSVDNINPMTSKRMGMGLQSNGPIVAPARASSWSGGFPDTLSNKVSDFKPSFDAMSAIPKNPSSLSSGRPPVANGGNLGDELHEVEL